MVQTAVCCISFLCVCSICVQSNDCLIRKLEELTIESILYTPTASYSPSKHIFTSVHLLLFTQKLLSNKVNKP